jgi:hypothetical protein
MKCNQCEYLFINGEFMPGKHLGKKITFKALPIGCQKLVKQDLDGEEVA